MAVQYAPLFSLETQFQAKDGSNNTAGWLKVYLAATDDPAETYSDYLGTRNPEKIVLDDNGRAVVICDKAKAYRLEVYDADGMLMWTEEPKYCSGTGGGGISVTEVVSTDGSIAVESSVAGSMRTYDISIAPDNAKELLEWAKCSNTVDGDGYVYPLYGEGTMQTQAGKGLEVFKDRYYHLTNKITVIPSGEGIDYETITVQVMHDDDQGTIVSLCSHDFDIDNSVSDKVELEFSEDIIPENDGFLVWRVTGSAPFNYVGLDMQIHRIYSGINAVPGSIASKVWVNQQISSKIDYSSLEYNSQNLITGISGSAIASNAVDPNEYIPWSASGSFQPSGSYLSASDASSFYPMTGNPSGFVTDSAFNSSISSKLDASASSMFAPSGNYQSALTFGYDENNKISSIDGSGIGGHYSGIFPVYVDNTAETISVDSIPLEVDDTMTAYASGDNVVIGVRSGLYAFDSAMSSKLDSSAFSTVSGDFLTAVPSSYATESYVDSAVSSKLDVTASSLFITALPTDLATTSDVESAVSGKLDSSASGEFYPMTGNPSGFLTAHQSLAEYATEQYVDSSVSGKLDSTAYNSAQFILTSQSGVFQPSGYYQPSGEYLSATESSNYYSTSNPSGFITGVDLSDYQKTADMSGFIPTSESSNYQQTGAMTAYQETANMTAYIPVSALGLVEI